MLQVSFWSIVYDAGSRTRQRSNSGAICHPRMRCVLDNMVADKRIRQSYLHLRLYYVFFHSRRSQKVTARVRLLVPRSALPIAEPVATTRSPVPRLAPSIPSRLPDMISGCGWTAPGCPRLSPGLLVAWARRNFARPSRISAQRGTWGTWPTWTWLSPQPYTGSLPGSGTTRDGRWVNSGRRRIGRD